MNSAKNIRVQIMAGEWIDYELVQSSADAEWLVSVLRGRGYTVRIAP